MKLLNRLHLARLVRSGINMKCYAWYGVIVSGLVSDDLLMHTATGTWAPREQVAFVSARPQLHSECSRRRCRRRRSVLASAHTHP
jgi:hypothetical protein